jgi:ribosomal protein S27AE
MIEELTDQRKVYECPKCGADYDAAGNCTMDGSALVATRVDYSCPADGKPVEKAGQCPRCAMHARIDKTALASDAAAPAPAATGGHR